MRVWEQVEIATALLVVICYNSTCTYEIESSLFPLVQVFSQVFNVCTASRLLHMANLFTDTKREHGYWGEPERAPH